MNVEPEVAQLLSDLRVTKCALDNLQESMGNVRSLPADMSLHVAQEMTQLLYFVFDLLRIERLSIAEEFQPDVKNAALMVQAAEGTIKQIVARMSVEGRVT